MVDAGFTDLVRPAKYGSFHRISIAGRDERDGLTDVVVAGPMCESGDIFTRDGHELLARGACQRRASAICSCCMTRARTDTR